MKTKLFISLLAIIFFSSFFQINESRNFDNELKEIETLDRKTDFERELFYLTNSERENKLRLDECMNKMAILRAKYLVDNDIFAHYSPDGTGPFEHLEACGDYDRVGENLIKNFSDAEEAHTALMNSQGHKENILRDGFKSLGVGCYKNVCVEFFKG